MEHFKRWTTELSLWKINFITDAHTAKTLSSWIHGQCISLRGLIPLFNLLQIKYSKVEHIQSCEALKPAYRIDLNFTLNVVLT